MLHLDNRGQWMIISAFIFGIMVISVASYYYELISSKTRFGIEDLPYYEVRTLITEVTRAYKFYDVNPGETSTNKALINLTKIYAMKGYYVNCTLSPGSSENMAKIYLEFISEKARYEVEKNISRV